MKAIIGIALGAGLLVAACAEVEVPLPGERVAVVGRATRAIHGVVSEDEETVSSAGRQCACGESRVRTATNEAVAGGYVSRWIGSAIF